MNLFTIDRVYEASYEIKRSEFLSFLVPIERFDEVYDRLKKEHKKANHIVWAKRFLNEFDQIVENSTDDGEPKGTSGVPSLNVLRGEGLINAGVLIVRYFGGIKLGTGGIARAYSEAVKEVLREAKLFPYEKREILEFETSYKDVQKIEYFLRNLDVDFKDRVFKETGILWRVEVGKEQKEKIEKFL